MENWLYAFLVNFGNSVIQKSVAKKKKNKKKMLNSHIEA